MKTHHPTAAASAARSLFAILGLPASLQRRLPAAAGGRRVPRFPGLAAPGVRPLALESGCGPPGRAGFPEQRRRRRGDDVRGLT